MINERYRCEMSFTTKSGVQIGVGNYNADDVLKLESRRTLTRYGFFYPENGGPQPVPDKDDSYYGYEP